MISGLRRAALLGATLVVCACSAGPEASPPVAPPATPGTPTPVIVLSSDSVAATVIAGDKPVTLDVQISSGTAAALAGVAVGQVVVIPAVSADAVTASVAAAAAPMTLSIRFDPGSLAPGTYVATIPINATGAAAKTVQGRLTVRAHPVLLVDQSSFALDVQAGDSAPTQLVHVTSSADAIGLLTLGGPSCTTQGGWLTPVLAGSGTPSVVSLAIASRTLAAGHYACRVNVATSQALVDSASRPIDVAIDVRQAPRIAVSTLDVHGSTTAGTDVDIATLGVTNGGNGTLDQLAVATNYGPGSQTGWLHATLDTTIAPAKLFLSGSAAALFPGSYTATATLSSRASGVVNSPQAIAITLLVIPKPFIFVIAPSSLSFTMKHNGAFPPAQALSLLDANGGSSTIKSLVPAGDFIPWATSSFGGNVPVSGQFVIAGQLPVGNYSERLTITLANGTSATLTVTLSVTP